LTDHRSIKALDSMNEWRTRPLDPVYPVVFVDAVHVKDPGSVDDLVVPDSVGHLAKITRLRRRSRFARPNICRLSIFSRLLFPSTGPEL
jgi:hypothetical protein